MTNEFQSGRAQYPPPSYSARPGYDRNAHIYVSQHAAASADPNSTVPVRPAQHEKPKNRRVLLWSLVIAIGLGVMCGAGTLFVFVKAAGDAVEQIDKELQYGDTEKREATKVTSCKVDRTQLVNVGFEIKNTTDRVQSYLLTFEIKDAKGVRIGEASTAVNSLAPGDTVKDSVPSSVRNPAKGFTCALARVD